MITEALKVALPDTSLQQEWVKLRKKIGERAAKRNLLAHYTITGHLPEDGTAVTLRLARSIFDARDKYRQEIDLGQLEEYGHLFRQLAEVIGAFATRVHKALPG